VGVEAVYTHHLDPDVDVKLARDYDVAVIANTRIAMLKGAPPRLWRCAKRRVLWFWDLRPGEVGAPLRGRVDHVYLSYRGAWSTTSGKPYAPAQWAKAMGCPVGYAPQASPLRSPVLADVEPHRVVFVGDCANKTYHRGRAQMCVALGAKVINSRHRHERLAIEARMPELYRSSRYVLSMSPRAPGYTSVRTYSILACGGLLLLHRFPDADRLFTHREHALLFDTAEEAATLLAELDEKEHERDWIAANGRRLHATKHTIAHRVLSICAEVEGLSQGFNGWLS
jgi:hypothetical protein